MRSYANSRTCSKSGAAELSSEFCVARCLVRSIAEAVAVVMRPPLSDAEKAEGVRRLLRRVAMTAPTDR